MRVDVPGAGGFLRAGILIHSKGFENRVAVEDVLTAPIYRGGHFAGLALPPELPGAIAR